MGKQIEYYNRYSKRVEIEPVYGEKFLKLLYNSRFGNLTLRFLVKRKMFSAIWGNIMRRPYSKKYILPFVRKYHINTDILDQRVDTFKTFDEFFSRKLRTSARPIVTWPGTVVFPCDGRHLLIQNPKNLPDFFIKGQTFDLEALLLNKDLAKEFKNGQIVISRLAPIDYHRFHFPCDATIKKIYKINGDYKSVNPIATKKNIKIFFENKRIVSVMHSDEIGNFLMVEVGATGVGSIHQTAKAGVAYKKGDEKGYFSFGGSTIITIFQNNHIRFAEDLKRASASGMEMFALMGDDLGRKI